MLSSKFESFFTKNHEIVRVDSNGLAQIGFTKFALQGSEVPSQLLFSRIPEYAFKDIPFSELSFSSGNHTRFSIPVSGHVTNVNKGLKKNPDAILKRMIGGSLDSAFLLSVQLEDRSDLESLMSQEEYDHFISSGEAISQSKKPLLDIIDETKGSSIDHGLAIASHTASHDAAQSMFSSVITDLEKELGPEKVLFPREIIWLGGAPGAGKGTNTPFISKARDISAKPIVMSDLFKTPEMRRLMDQGLLINDGVVLRLLMKELLKPKYRDGVIVDGFPRTATQGACVECLHRYMTEQKIRYEDTDMASSFAQPLFRIVVLYVSEHVAVERQLGRGKKQLAHNKRVEETGIGEIQKVRATDLEPELAKKRYRVFEEETQEALSCFRELFDYHVIDANRPIDQVEKAIEEEFKYQSSLELDAITFDSIRNIPRSVDLTRHARQRLVRRLDTYQRDFKGVFSKVISVIENEIVPTLQIHAFSGCARVRVRDTVLAKDLAVQMLVDIMADRGFAVKVDRRTARDPSRVNIESGTIITDFRDEYIMDIEWAAPTL
ncbi:putative multi-domain containing protein [Aduncisulcus paluster]|uniref:Multi-domain containing protein n=1 Tax=Aduncisulcus paluster TaxID=2918883 RepID=A0ABQ5KQ04_9EUKA|nr:putative multi-domain containing protein [Aduncisulcus paluster]